MEPMECDRAQQEHYSPPAEQSVKVPIARQKQRKRAAPDAAPPRIAAPKDRAQEQRPRADSAQPILPPQIKIAGHPFLAEKQSRPRNRAIKNIGMNYLAQGPLLPVGGLDFAAKQQPMTGAMQSHAQLDVLDAGPAVRFIEPLCLFECLPSKRSATGPKSGRFAPAHLVDVMVQKISILRHDSFARRSFVVGSKNGGHIFLRAKLFFHPAKCVPMHGDVAVYKNNNVAGSGPHSTIARGRRPASAACELDHRATPRESDRGRLVGRAVIDDDNLIRRAGRRSQRFQTSWKMAGAVMNRNNDAQSWDEVVGGRERLHAEATRHSRRSGQRQPIAE